jgi:hypothetical protein
MISLAFCAAWLTVWQPVDNITAAATADTLNNFAETTVLSSLTRSALTDPGQPALRKS